MATITYKFGEKIYLGNADSLSVIVDKIFENKEATTIAFDMEKVRLCDSYGLKFLINYQRRANSTGKKLILYRPDQFLREMITSTKLAHFFTIQDSLDSTAEGSKA